MTDHSSVLELNDVSKTFHRSGTSVTAVDGVHLTVGVGETVGLVGESGSGKTTLGRIGLLLLRPDGGQVIFESEDLTALKPVELRRRRARLQTVFQEPYEALDPQLSVRQAIAEPLELARPRRSRAEINRAVDEALDLVRLTKEKADRYPGQLSGGEQQRVGIARAIATRPSMVILDEPTSSLDLTVRAGIVRLLQELQQELGMSYLFISHDLDTVEYLADRIYVMYRGHIVESGATDEVLANPDSPYTALLQAARLDIDPDVEPAPLPSLPAGFTGI